MLRTPDPLLVARQAAVFAEFDIDVEAMYALPSPALYRVLDSIVKGTPRTPTPAMQELHKWLDIVRMQLARVTPCVLDSVAVSWTELNVRENCRVHGVGDQSVVFQVRNAMHLSVIKELHSSHFGMVYQCALVKRNGDDSFTPQHGTPNLVVKSYSIQAVSSGVSLAGRPVLESPVREFKALQLLGQSHNNILRAYACAECKGMYYSIFPFCETSLQRYAADLHRGGPGRRITNEPDLRLFSGLFLPPLNFIRRAVAHTSAALAFIHSRGLVHRDISLDNVLITTDAESNVVFKIIDFGLSKGLSLNALGTGWEPLQMDLDPAGQPLGVGKSLYECPETFAHRSSGGQGPFVYDGPAGDMWALGVALFSLAGGQAPFDRTSTLGFLQLESKVDAITHLNMLDDQDFCMLLKGLLALDPARRLGGLNVVKSPFCKESA